MKIFTKLSIVFFLFVALACEKETEEINTGIKGYWINQTYDDGITTYQRASELKKDAPGIVFNADGKMVERANSGSCGTPPVIYADYDGDWTQTESGILFIVDFWGGKVKRKWEVISVDNSKLVVKETILDREY